MPMSGRGSALRASDSSPSEAAPLRSPIPSLGNVRPGWQRGLSPSIQEPAMHVLPLFAAATTLAAVSLPVSHVDARPIEVSHFVNEFVDGPYDCDALTTAVTQ